jgi:hypothetical protein
MTIFGRPWNSWDGTHIFITLDCDECYYKEYHPENSLPVCLYGVAWKYLVERDKKMRKCVKLKEERRNVGG